MRSFLALATLALSSRIVSADNTWSLWFNEKERCGGWSYNVVGANDAGCTIVDPSHFPFNALTSVLIDSNIPSGYCKLLVYNGTDCDQDGMDYTAYSTDTSGGGQGKGHYCWGLPPTPSLSSWKMVCES